MTDMYAGSVRGVYELELGDKLSAAAAVSDTVLHVYSVVDFADEGGCLRLNDTVLEYVSRDEDDLTVTLASPLAAAAAVDDVVTLWDQANDQPSTVYKAVLDDIDGFTGEVSEAYVSQSIAHALATTMRDGKGESVILSRDSGSLEVVGVSGRLFALAALQYLQGGMTTRQSDDESGVDILGAESGVPGVYVISDDGSYIALKTDALAGTLEFGTGIAGDTPGSIDPGTDRSVGFISPAAASIIAAAMTLRGDATTPRLILSGTDLRLDFNDTSHGDPQRGGNITAAGTIQGNKVLVISPDTTTNATNVVYEGANNQLRKQTSLSRHKLEQQPLTVADVIGLLDVDAKTWFDANEVAENDGSTEGLRRIPGVVAEDIEAHVPVLATYDHEGDLQGVAYDRLGAALIPIIRDQRDRIERLEALVDELTRETR